MIGFLKNEDILDILDPNALIDIPSPRVNCLKSIPFTAAHTYIAHIWQYPSPPPPPPPQGRRESGAWGPLARFLAVRLARPNRRACLQATI